MAIQIKLKKIVTRQVDACHLLAPGIPTDGSTRPDFRKDQLDFSEWRSVDPLISWFGKIVNLFGALLSVVLIGVCFLYFIFPTTNEK